MADLFALVFEVVATIVAEMIAWPARRPATPREPKPLPEGTTARIATALAAGADAAALLPDGWRGFHSSIVDAPSPKLGDTVSVGTELHLVRRPEPVGDMASYAVVAPMHGTIAPLGTMTNQELDRGIELGRVRCWLAGRKPTLRSASAVVLFVAVYDP